MGANAENSGGAGLFQSDEDRVGVNQRYITRSRVVNRNRVVIRAQASVVEGLGGPPGRVHEHHSCDEDRGNDDEWLSAPIFATQVVGPRGHQRICDCIDAHGGSAPECQRGHADS